MNVKAAVILAPGEIEIKEFPYPEVDDDTALMKMEMSGICGTDNHMYKGETVHLGVHDTPFPIIPGHENVGTLADIGEVAAGKMEIEGGNLKKGDRVVAACDVLCGECYNCRHTFGYAWCENQLEYGTLLSCSKSPYLFGGWAEYMYILPKVFLFKVPDGMKLETAVLTEEMAVAYGSLLKAALPYPLALEGFGPGDTVVVQGPGPLGICHAIMARIMGAGDIIIVGPGIEDSEVRMGLVERLGIADQTINISEPKERVDEVLKLTGGRGADLVVECTDSPHAVGEGLEMLRKGGTFIEAGNFVDVGPTTLNPNVLICGNNARIIGVTSMPYQGYSKVLRIMERHSKNIPFDKVVTHSFTIDEAEKALSTTIGGRCLKAVITP